MKSEKVQAPEGLNSYQENRLWASLWYVDKLLRSVEDILAEPNSPSPFRGYVADVTAGQRAEIEQSIADIRRALVETLERQQVPVPEPKISALHAIRTNLDYADIAVAELAPRHMKGYGGLGEGAIPQLEAMVRDLGGRVRRLHRKLGGTLPEE